MQRSTGKLCASDTPWWKRHGVCTPRPKERNQGMRDKGRLSPGQEECLAGQMLSPRSLVQHPGNMVVRCGIPSTCQGIKRGKEEVSRSTLRAQFQHLSDFPLCSHVLTIPKMALTLGFGEHSGSTPQHWSCTSHCLSPVPCPHGSAAKGIQLFSHFLSLLIMGS